MENTINQSQELDGSTTKPKGTIVTKFINIHAQTPIRKLNEHQNKEEDFLCLHVDHFLNALPAIKAHCLVTLYKTYRIHIKNVDVKIQKLEKEAAGFTSIADYIAEHAKGVRQLAEEMKASGKPLVCITVVESRFALDLLEKKVESDFLGNGNFYKELENGEAILHKAQDSFDFARKSLHVGARTKSIIRRKTDAIITTVSL